MSSKYRIKNQEALHYLTLTVVGWVDIFSRKIYKDIIIESLKFCQQNKGLEIYGYVIMSNHIHLLAKTKETYNLSDTIRDFKKYTSKKILNTIQEEPESRREWMLSIFKIAGKSNSNNKEYQFWQQDNHAIECVSNSFMAEKLNYLHNNPVRAGLVSKVEDYLYSSARNYASEEFVLEIDLLTLPIITYN